MIQVARAILHSFDLSTGQKSLSAQELDLDNKKTKSFVQRHVRKASNNPDNNHGVFVDDSAFAQELSSYLIGQVSFVDFSQQLGQFFFEELRKGDDDTPCDLLVVEFEDSISDTQAAQSQDAADAQFEGVEIRYFAILLLPRKEIFMHNMRPVNGASLAEILRTDAALPSPTQKIDSYCVVNCDDMTVAFHDKERTIAGQPSFIIPDGLLRCTKEASSTQVIEAVEEIVDDIAQQAGQNSALAISKAKSYLTETIMHDMPIEPLEVGRAVFEDDEQAAKQYEEKFLAKAQREAMPQQIAVKRSQASRMTKNHKIKTDTGIEISFPSEMANDSEFIEFTNESDGSISIRIKKISAIENR